MDRFRSETERKAARKGDLQEVDDHITDNYAEWIDVSIFLQETVEFLKFCERLGDVKERSVRARSLVRRGPN